MRTTLLVSLFVIFGCGDDDGVADVGTDASDAAIDVPTVDAPDDAGADASDAAGGCAANDECAATEYCAAESCDGNGTCEARPEGCADIFDPVCGCDGTTYGNACEAASAGVRVASMGECPCMDNGDCEEAEYCMKTACGEATGECATRPATCDDVGLGACGCDGMTYISACWVARAGVNLASEGECPCMDNDDCEETEYCMKAACDATEGSCEARPSRCDDVGLGACGCDGTTYISECWVALAGENVASTGPCP